MVQTYTEKRDQEKLLSLSEFHHKHLTLFLGRFRQFVSRFPTPSSSLLSHDIFLVLAAVTQVARSDLEDESSVGSIPEQVFLNYFAAFDVLVSGLQPLDTAADACAQALIVDGK